MDKLPVMDFLAGCLFSYFQPSAICNKDGCRKPVISIVLSSKTYLYPNIPQKSYVSLVRLSLQFSAISMVLTRFLCHVCVKPTLDAVIRHNEYFTFKKKKLPI